MSEPSRDRLILHELMHEFVKALNGDADLAIRILGQCRARVDAALNQPKEPTNDRS